MRSLHLLIVVTAAAGLIACSQEEGVYGSSSGPNPNLADLQNPPPTETRPPADPATQGEHAYPSQTGQPGEPPTGGEGGRSSAETGATDDGS